MVTNEKHRTKHKAAVSAPDLRRGANYMDLYFSSPFIGSKRRRREKIGFIAEMGAVIIEMALGKWLL